MEHTLELLVVPIKGNFIGHCWSDSVGLPTSMC